MSRIKPILLASRSMAPMPPGVEALDAIGEFVVDVAGGHHRLFAFRTGAVRDAIEDPALTFAQSSPVVFPGFLAVAFWGFLGYSSSHSKASFNWNSEDVLIPPLFQNLPEVFESFLGFSLGSFFLTLG